MQRGLTFWFSCGDQVASQAAQPNRALEQARCKVVRVHGVCLVHRLIQKDAADGGNDEGLYRVQDFAGDYRWR